MNRITQMDPEWFSLETCGKLVMWPEAQQVPALPPVTQASDDQAGANGSPSRKKKESAPPPPPVESPVEIVSVKEISELVEAMFANFQRALVSFFLPLSLE